MIDKKQVKKDLEAVSLVAAIVLFYLFIISFGIVATTELAGKTNYVPAAIEKLVAFAILLLYAGKLAQRWTE